MIKEATASAPGYEEAKSSAIARLNAPAGVEVKTEIVKFDKEKKKVLGIFGGSPAKYTVKAFYEDNSAPAPVPAPAAKPAPVSAPASSPAPAASPASSTKSASSAPSSEMFAKAEDYLRNILKSLGIEEVTINFEDSDEEVSITLECGEDYGSVIGRRGETLDAIQYLTRLVINRGTEGYKRVSINIGDYRQKRENTLRSLARKTAARVKKYGKNVTLDPMNPYERRIIHTTIQEIEGVTSHSVGSDGDRKVVISLEDGFKPTGSGYSKGGQRGGKGGRDHKGGRPPRKQPYQPSGEPRAPRSDSASASLYGKIEINKD